MASVCVYAYAQLMPLPVCRSTHLVGCLFVCLSVPDRLSVCLLLCLVNPCFAAYSESVVMTDAMDSFKSKAAL